MNSTPLGSSSRSDRPHLVLAGAGHAHLYTLKRTRELINAGCAVTLVAPENFWYSGLATGMLGGAYPPEQDQVDVEQLVARGGGQFLRTSIEAINPTQRIVHLGGGSTVRYDYLSLNLGSRVPLERLPGAAEHGVPVKPIHRLLHLRQDLETRLPQTGPDRPLRAVVVGGGYTGCELAANLRELSDRLGGWCEITVITSAHRPLADRPARVSRVISEALNKREIEVRCGVRVTEVTSDEVQCDDGQTFAYDVLLHAFGLRPPRLMSQLGLPCDEEGALLVDEHLRSVGDPRIFGGGDCVNLAGRSLAKVGVYAIRQAPILFHNLRATIHGRPLKKFRPQRQFLLIVNLGRHEGLALWGPLHYRGRLALRLKDWLDRRFLAGYQ